ncbi:GNAT family N-acetyltransferase [Aliiruegeria sabulilitoris]|uniref:GNAT family N-acetyltransferase n=1 Tax=Aliiruegeria sabulilitoris TaxID=1510458 RepID=UPI00082DEC99|nr:GNAT family N-acetyltransferase [Aliiruegeria sabulilitoris]NDR59242.1 GNAT family N-acetyltransferase [Pseudoruegeria sp. M32A2M]
MTDFSIRRANPREPGATSLLKASHGLMEELYPSDANYFLPIDALCMPGIHFYVAERGGRSLGCAALAEREGYGEIKSMFVDPDARGMGMADRLLEQLTSVARERGITLLRLESGKTLELAHRLYRRHGFVECERFGEYPDSPHSIFMEKAL